MRMRTTLDRAFPLLMKQLELMLTSGELNPRHQHTITLYAKGLTCEADTPWLVVTLIWLFIRHRQKSKSPYNPDISPLSPPHVTEKILR